MESMDEALTIASLPEWGLQIGTAAHSLTLLRDQLFVAQEQLNRELMAVGEIQQSMLPDSLPFIPGFDVATHYQPCAMAGGDYFDIVPLDRDRWGLIIADVAGHGVSATVVMAVMRSLVHAHLQLTTQYMSSNRFLEFMNRQMCGPYTIGGRFVTVWCAVLDPVGRLLTYASAGHNPPRLLRRGTIISLDEARGLPLGIDERATYEEFTIPLESGDLLLAYTDGFTEAVREKNGEKDYFGTDRLDQVLINSSEARAHEWIVRVTRVVNEFTGSHIPMDDQTLLVIVVE